MRDSKDSKQRFMIGDSHTSTYYDRHVHNRLSLNQNTKNMYRIKLQNIDNHTKPTPTDTRYQMLLSQYHDLYLNCLAKKNEPVLTKMIRAKIKSPDAKDKFKLFVKYNSGVKGSLL